MSDLDDGLEKMKSKIGCVGIVYSKQKNKILGIESAKRGLFLPGGKFEEHDYTFRYAASREVEEETGIIVDEDSWKLIFHGMNPKSYYVYYFLSTKFGGLTANETEDGKPGWFTAQEFIDKTATFMYHYDLLFDKNCGIVNKKLRKVRS